MWQTKNNIEMEKTNKWQTKTNYLEQTLLK